MKTTYVCPDCGQEMENNQNDCPNCGCPAIALLEKAPRSAITDTSSIQAIKNKGTDEYIYYSDDIINITNKLWSFGGWDTVDQKSVAVYFPTDNISSVSISCNWGAFVFWLVLGLISMGIGIYLLAEWGIEDIGGWVLTVLAIVSFIIAFIMRNKKDIVVKAFHTSATFRYTINDPEKSKQLLNSMLKCLIDNR
jgi:hypothetical protein